MNVKEIIKKLTIDEKISLLEGKGKWLTNDIARLNVLSIRLSDGPHGIRKEKEDSKVSDLYNTYPSICFMSEAALANSFDKELAYKYGEVLGREAINSNVGVVLAPGVNIKRNPICGRNFEYYSEDPYLSGVMSREVVQGIESCNVASTIKHYACNSQEKYRMSINSVVDERCLREIYLKPFEICLKKPVSAVMTSYNLINGSYASENEHLIKEILRHEFKFKGLVMTDWGGVNDRCLGLNAGCDLEMPSSLGYNAQKIKEAYLKGEITTDVIDASCERVLSLVDRLSVNLPKEEDYKSVHDKVCEMASECNVLLKNEANILPLREFDKVLYVGEVCKKMYYQGGGSSKINSYIEESIVDLMKNYSTKCDYCDGYALNKNNNEKLLKEAINKAKDYNKIVIALKGEDEIEGRDRQSISISPEQVKLVEELCKVNRNIVLLVFSGGVVDLSFTNKVKGILYCSLGGEGSSRGVLDNLYGKVNPSGRLSETFALRLDDYPSMKYYDKSSKNAFYKESIYVGYRYFTTFNKKVMYPFGYGLSYTNFTYSNLRVSQTAIVKTKKIKVKCDVKNTGSVAGKEVVMVFIENDPASKVYKAKRELREFTKVYLKPNETKTVEFDLEYNDFAYYDTNMKTYYSDPGVYKIQICKNANEVVLSQSVERKDNTSFDYTAPQAYYKRDKLNVTDEEFGSIIPENSIIKQSKEITMANNLEDVSGKLIGKIIKKVMVNYAKKHDIFSEAITLETLTTTPFKTIALYANDLRMYEVFEGIVDSCNNHLIKGVKRIMKALKAK